MARPRRFDWDEARRRRAAGESYASIARSLGVSQTAVARVCDPLVAVELAANTARRQTSGTCQRCGAPCSLNTSRQERATCRSCWAELRAAVIWAGPGEPIAAKCSDCKHWLSPDHFYRSGPPGRASLTKTCRDCNAARRRAYRDLHPDQYARELERDRERRRRKRTVA